MARRVGSGVRGLAGVMTGTGGGGVTGKAIATPSKGKAAFIRRKASNLFDYISYNFNFWFWIIYHPLG